MAWIEYHTQLRDHWKVKRLSVILEVDYISALGAISCLWLWAAEYAKDGNVTRFSNEELRDAARCNCQKFTLEALKKCELVDGKGRINDWSKHGLKLLESTRKRVREYRLRKRNSNVTDTPTKPNLTIPNQPNQKDNSKFSEFWILYPKQVGMSMALLTFNATIKTDKDFEDLMAALKNYKASDEVKRGFVKNGDRWIEDWRGWIPKATDPLKKYEVLK